MLRKSGQTDFSGKPVCRYSCPMKALNCVALGTGIAVENIDIYRKGFMTSK